MRIARYNSPPIIRESNSSFDAACAIKVTRVEIPRSEIVLESMRGHWQFVKIFPSLRNFQPVGQVWEEALKEWCGKYFSHFLEELGKILEFI